MIKTYRLFSNNSIITNIKKEIELQNALTEHTSKDIVKLLDLQKSKLSLHIYQGAQAGSWKENNNTTIETIEGLIDTLKTPFQS